MDCLECGKKINSTMWNRIYCCDCLDRHRKQRAATERYQKRANNGVLVAVGCIDCGRIILPSQMKGRPLYCHVCKKIRYEKYKEDLLHHVPTNSNLSAHRHPDFTTEETRVENELRHLGLRSRKKWGSREHKKEVEKYNQK